MSDRFKSRADLAGKIEWHGGIMAALPFGIMTDDMPEGDTELAEAWAKLEASFRQTAALAEAVEVMLPGPGSEDDDMPECGSCGFSPTYGTDDQGAGCAASAPSTPYATAKR